MSPHLLRASRRRGLMKHALALTAVLSLSACTGSADTGRAMPVTPGSSGTAAPGARSPSSGSAATAPEGSGDGTPIRVVIDGQVLTGRLWDNAAARDLISRLPLTVSFRDLSNQEKIGHLDRPLSMDGMPEGDDPVPGDIGWYAPWGNVVLYYGDVGYWDGIARIGMFDGGTDPIEAQTRDFTATIELAR
jgi:hypothetical protein